MPLRKSFTTLVGYVHGIVQGVTMIPISRYYSIIVWLIVLFLGLQALTVQQLTPMNGDVAFLLNMAQNTGLSGFYNSFYEVNPPLIVYIYKVFLIPTYFGLNDVSSLNASMVIYILFCTVLCNVNLRVAESPFATSVTLAFAVSLFAVSQYVFLQREHLIAAGLTVYLTSIIRTIESKRKLNLVTSFFTGLVSAVSFALKPQYIIVLLVMELFVLLKKKRLTFRTELYAILFYAIFYAALVYFFQKEYIEFMIPLAKSYYGSYFNDFTALMTICGVIIVCSIAPLRILTLSKVSSNIIFILTLTMIGCMMAYLAGRTGFAYHLIPTFVIFCAINILAIIHGVACFNAENRVRLLIYFVAIVTAFFLLNQKGLLRSVDLRYDKAWERAFYEVPNLEKSMLSFDGISHPELYQLAEKIQQNSGVNDEFYAFTDGMFAHTLSVHAGLNWRSRLPNFWLIPEPARRPQEPESQETLALVRTSVLEDLATFRPELILLEEQDFSSLYGEGFTFQKFFFSTEEGKDIFSSYNLLTEVEGKYATYKLYKRRE